MQTAMWIVVGFLAVVGLLAILIAGVFLSLTLRLNLRKTNRANAISNRIQLTSCARL